MSAKVIAEFEQIKIEILEVEKRIQSEMELMVRQQNIQMERCNDHGVRGFALMVYFDDLNLASFNPDNIKGFFKLLTEYQLIRKKQKSIERELNKEWKIEQQMKASVDRGEL